MIAVNCTVQFKKVNDISEIRNLLEENVIKQWIEIIAFYDTYRYNLSKLELYYNNMDKAWTEFCQQTTPQMLGEKLQLFKEANQSLITEIRKKY